MAKNDGKQLEKLTEEIYKALLNSPLHGARGAKIKRDEKIESVDGAKRQIDVSIRTPLGPSEIFTIVECKDHGRKVGVEEIDKLHSKGMDIGAHKLVMVSRLALVLACCLKEAAECPAT